jgi:hypothetical protein
MNEVFQLTGRQLLEILIPACALGMSFGMFVAACIYGRD